MHQKLKFDKIRFGYNLRFKKWLLDFAGGKSQEDKQLKFLQAQWYSGHGL